MSKRKPTIADLLIKIGADISELKTGSDKALATMDPPSKPPMRFWPHCLWYPRVK